MRLTSQVIITSQIENTISKLEDLRSDEKIIEIMPDKLMEVKEDKVYDINVHRIVGEKVSFSMADAKVVIEKAYMASEEITIIILIAPKFSTDVQNKLLKILEEPPKNKEFILVTESKSAILPTIKSRLPITVLSENKDEEDFDLDLKQLSLATVYDFIQKHKRTDGKMMKKLVERISKEAITSQEYDLDEAALNLFTNAFLALDVGSPPQFVLNTLLLKLLARKKR
jgi:DNA polymerase-3 subunit delta'